MTQQIINVGAVANDGTGESLRSAFQAVNDNFSNVWAQGPVDSQVVISNNVISTNQTNRNLVLRPDGTGVITVASSVVPSIDSVWDLGAANAQYDSVFARYYYGDASNMTGLPQPTDLEAVNTDILPIATRAFDIGSQTRQWNQIYTAGITAGNASVITINVGNLHIPGGLNGYVLQTDGTGNLSWTAQTGGGGNGTPGGSNTQVQFNDAGTFGGAPGFTFDYVTDVLTVPGDILPFGNNTQSLGSATRQWQDLWVSNNTIYINSLPLTLSEENVLSINGNALVQQSANGTQVNIGNFVFNGDSLQNNLGGSFNNGGLVQGATAGLSLPVQGNDSDVQLFNTYGDVTITAADTPGNTVVWRFAQDGTLTAAGNIVSGNITTDGSVIFANGQGAAGQVGFTATGPEINGYINKSVTINTNDNTYAWNFGTAGNLTLPDGSVVVEGGLYGNGAAVLGNSTGDIQVYAQNSGVGIQTSDGNVYNTWFYDRNGNLTLPGNTFAVNYANGMPVSIGNGGGSATLPLANGTSNFDIATANGNATITVADSQTWMFDNTGNLVTPANLVIGPSPAGGSSILQYDSALQIVGEGANAIVIMGWAANQSAPDSIAVVGVNTPYLNGAANALIAVGNNATTVNYWNFANDGTTTFPTLTVDLHNGGNQAAQTLQFGDATQQAVITGPTPIVPNTPAQRLIIQGQRGNGTGEGGDVYLWAGDADTNGGDIKIYAGDADNGATGSGGYINIDGGRGFDNGGAVSISGGQSTNATGAPVNLSGGYGGQTGGAISIQGGYGQGSDGGAVSIVGGVSGNGLGSYGNVIIGAGASTWTFDNSGNLSLPGGGIVYGSPYTPSGAPGNTITLQPAGSGTITDQRLLVYPTAGDGDHIHLTSGNLYQTELFLGSDNLYVKLAATGDVVVNSNDGTGNTAQWTFDTSGLLTVPGSISANTTIFGVYQANAVGMIAGPVNVDIGDQATASFLRINLGNIANNYAGIQGDVELATPLNTAPLDPSSIYIAPQEGAYRWKFSGSDGNLTMPAGGYFRVSGGISAYPVASPAPTISGFSTISAIDLSASGNVIGGNLFTSSLVSTPSGTDMYIDPNNQGIGYILVSGFHDGGESLSIVNQYTGSDGIYFVTETSQFRMYQNQLIFPDSTVQTTAYTGTTYGNSDVATFLAAYGSNTVSTTGNITAGNFVGSGSNVDIVAGSYDWRFDNTGNLTLPGNTFAVNYANGTPINPVTKLTGSWTVTAGTANYSFSVDGGHTYTMWVNGNIPNGIIVWNATATVTNTNVPVIGSQYAWYYQTGNALVLNSIPSQIIGTAGTISNAAPAVANTNVFTFSITNNSGSTQAVSYGWARVS